MKHQLIVPAAGSGKRLGFECPKALVDLSGKPLLVRTLERFIPLDLLDNAIIPVSPGHEADFQDALTMAFPAVEFRFVAGGAERQQSVANALSALDADTDIVIVHDAARPFVADTAIQEVLQAAETFGAATLAIPSIDTLSLIHI